MLKPVQALLSVLAHASQRELARQIQYLKTENRVLRAKLPKRISVTPQERSRLLKFGAPVGAADRGFLDLRPLGPRRGQ